MGILLLISAQIMISWFVGRSPVLGSALTAWSLLGILFLPLSFIKKKKKRMDKIIDSVQEKSSISLYTDSYKKGEGLIPGK